MFSAPALQRILDRRERESLRSVPFFDGLLAGEIDALLGSFAGVPEVHHPVRGRIKGERAFRQFVAEMTSWFAARTAEVEDVDVILTPSRGIEEVVLHLDPEQDGRRIGLPLSLAADHDGDGRIAEIRLYFSTRPLTGRSANRPPLLQADAALDLPDIVGEYPRALAAGDVDARLEYCTVTDDGRACAVEYNVIRWGGVEVAPQAGLAVCDRRDTGQSGAVRAYGDVDPPPGADAADLTRAG